MRVSRRNPTQAFLPFSAGESSSGTPWELELLNRKCHATGKYGWEPIGVPRLWRYHLHYFDEWGTGSGDASLVADWIAANAPGVGTGWEPYPLSRRIPNWIKGFIRRGLRNEAFDASLAQQASILEQTLEYHLLANHLLANLRGLVFSGAYFAGRDADRWLQTGVNEYGAQMREQIAIDGGHEERSPMYHSIVLSDLLDLIELARVFPGRIPEAAVSEWMSIAARMHGWLLGVLHPDGRIPFFQDSAFAIAPEPPVLASKARDLGVPHQGPADIEASGFARLDGGGAVVLADLGAPGPDHQPGHAHAAMLAFELSVDSQRFLVNTGTSTYQEGERRRHERSTGAHNTIRVGAMDQSEMWASFRVGRRARVLERGVLRDRAWARVRYQNGACVQRKFQIEPRSFVLFDSVEGHDSLPVELFFHLHPEINLRQIANSSFLLRSRKGTEVRLVLDPSLECGVEPFDWSPEFGKLVPGLRIAAKAREGLPAAWVHRIHYP